MENQLLFERRVAKILPSREELEKTIDQKGKIRLYQGFDPTGIRLHLGHSVGLRKLMEFAKAGHEVIFLFGTGTVLVGDPSERDSQRKLITQEEIEENIKDWKQQASPIVDFDLVTIKQNGDWLTPLTLKDIVKIASNISAVQLFKRDSFQRRLNAGDTVWYHETMYPLLQGYDSVVMDVDLEIGGTDQEFNMLVGRELQKKMNHREKFVLTTPMIKGTDGQNMSKTSGNCIWLNESPNEMFGKLLSITDDQIIPYMEIASDIDTTRVLEVKNQLKSETLHPMEAKKELALNVVTTLHDKTKARIALKHFEDTVQAGQAPDNIDTISIKSNDSMTILEICHQTGVGESSGQIKRTIKQGGVRYAGKKITDPNQTLKPKSGDILKFGKRSYRQIDIK